MVVFRSNKNIYAQLVDDMSNRTIIGASTLTKEIREEVHKASSKRERAKIVGKHVAHLAKEKNIVKIVLIGPDISIMDGSRHWRMALVKVVCNFN